MKKSVSIFLIVLFVALLGNLIAKGTQYVMGDGYEYMLMTESLSNHLSPDAQLTDVNSMYEKLKLHSKYTITNDKVLKGYTDLLQTNDNYTFGYFKANNNKYYSYHFWLYPLVNVPAFYITDLMHISPVKSFLITNAFIFILTLLCILKCNSLSNRQRAFIAVFYIVSGATYYFDWSHPELFTASLLLIGLLLLVENKLLGSAALLALAAQQNPPIGLIAMGILFWKGCLVLQKMLQTRKNILKQSLGFIIPAVCIAMIAIASPLFYYYHFGTPNLIVKSGAAATELITFYRFNSLFFDFNQGMIVAIPFVFLVLLLSFILIVASPKSLLNIKRRKEILLAVLMLVIAVLLAIPSLSTGNWNSGCSIVMRYAYWISMPIGVAAMLLVCGFPARIFKILFGIFCIGQIFVLANYSISGKGDYLTYKRFAVRIIRNHPAWYNPIPAIFVERGLQRDDISMLQSNIYYYVSRHDKSVTKILYNKINYNTKLEFCGDQSIAQIAKLVKPVETEGKWFYLNLPPNLCKTTSSLAHGFYSSPHPHLQ